MTRCAICRGEVTGDAPSILAFGGAGKPHVVCPTCEALLDGALLGTEPDAVREALRTLSDLRLANGDADRYTAREMNELMERGAERLRALEDGEPLSSEDEDALPTDGDEETPVEVPEELCESEADRALDRADEERERRQDVVYKRLMWAIWIVAGIAFVAWLLYLFLR